jgi:hypothetical protein
MMHAISGYNRLNYEIFHAFRLGISIMLLDYTVENYKSIKEPLTLSAIAATKPRDYEKTNGRYAADDKVGTPIPVADRGFALVPVIGILGANASGKTNVIESLGNLLICISAQGDAPWPYIAEPHRLDQNYRAEPTRFVMRMAIADHLYEYTLVIDSRIVHHELFRFMRPGSRRWIRFFERTWVSEQRKHAWHNNSEHAAPYVVLQPTLGHATPYLRLLASSFDIDILRPLSLWLALQWPGCGLGWEDSDHELSARLLAPARTGVVDRISSLIRRYDTGVSGLTVDAQRTTRFIDAIEVEVQHTTAEGTTESWPINRESLGTQRLFVLLTKVLGALDDGTILLLDELGSNIHPNITRDIVGWFQNPKINSNHAQLIFTTHDANLTRRTTLRRDEVWFTEKRADGSTRLFPLTDFKPRNDLLIERSYLDGRFGGVPITPSEDELIDEGLLTVRGGAG